ncbi:MAG: hypothetical protein ACR2RB_20885 [Gammaproteobacteria bacterium]
MTPATPLRLALTAMVYAATSQCWGFSRDAYPHWVDLDGDGRDTRQEVLIRDSLTAVTFRPDGNVDSGLWVCPYTGRVMRSAGEIDVDHLVALGEIDAAGGQGWSLGQRTAVANDPDNLISVYRGSNRSKGDRDAYLWLPPNISKCEWYLDARATVWEKYGLEVDADETKSVAFFREKCPLHEKGIKLNRVRRWLAGWFEGLF